MEREESRFSWLDKMEASRNIERAQRRAWSNNVLVGTDSNKHYGLINDDEHEGDSQPIHPVMMLSTMMEEDSEMEMETISISDSDSEDLFHQNISVRPIHPHHQQHQHIAMAFDQSRPRLSSCSSLDSLSSSDDDEMDSESENVPTTPVMKSPPRMWTRELLDSEMVSREVVDERTDLGSKMGKQQQQGGGWNTMGRREVAVVF